MTLDCIVHKVDGVNECWSSRKIRGAPKIQRSGSQVQCAKPYVRALFEDKYGRAKKMPYYVGQIQMFLEDKFSDDVVYQAIEQLVDIDHILLKYNAKTGVFIYNPKKYSSETDPLLKVHIDSACSLIDAYSDPKVTERYGKHLENLVRLELQRQGFRIVGADSKKFRDKEYKSNNSNLDLIAEHQSGKLNIGVEVKNTLSVLDKEEVITKLDICDCLGLKPVFAVRWLKPYASLVTDRGGFPWIFKKQIYPTEFTKLTKKLSKRLKLPTCVATELPTESVQPFNNWVETQTT